MVGRFAFNCGSGPCVFTTQFVWPQWRVHFPSMVRPFAFNGFFPAQAKLGTFDVHMAISNVSTRFIYVFVPPKTFLCADQSYRLYPVTAVPTSSVHFTHVFILVGLLSAQANLTSFTP